MALESMRSMGQRATELCVDKHVVDLTLQCYGREYVLGHAAPQALVTLFEAKYGELRKYMAVGVTDIRTADLVLDAFGELDAYLAEFDTLAEPLSHIRQEVRNLKVRFDALHARRE